jgi:hypothetical protein
MSERIVFVLTKYRDENPLEETIIGVFEEIELGKVIASG